LKNSCRNGSAYIGFDGLQLYTKEFIGEDENSLVLDVLSNDVDVDQGDTINITSVGEGSY
jgi:hypothetical protein